jgi:hypothetical protein
MDDWDDFGCEAWERDDDYNVFEEACLDADRAAGEFDDFVTDAVTGDDFPCDTCYDDCENCSLMRPATEFEAAVEEQAFGPNYFGV